MNRRTGVALALGVSGLATLAGLSSRPLRVATGYASHLLCSETFVSGLRPEDVYAETISTRPGFGLVAWGFHYDVDRAKREVRTSFLATAESRSVYRDGLGCLLVRGDGQADATMPPPEPVAASSLPPIADAGLVAPSGDAMRAALDRAFAETDAQPRRTKAVVVVHEGRVVAECYADGYRVETPVISWSVAKSVTNALVGILVRQGKLTIDAPAPVAAWQHPDDARRNITIEHLLRQTSGLELTETGSPIDRNSRLLFLERDTAGAAEDAALEAPPGKVWNYQTGNTLIVSQIVRDAVGGHAADIVRFARRELFGPLGMHDVTLEVDATGTPFGGTFMFATPRDWARFAMLYIDDGVVGGNRILPEGWVRFSSTQTVDSPYAAGFWLGSREWRARWKVPADLIVGAGVLGQRVVIAPSERLVIVRFGIADGPLSMELAGLGRLIADVRDALASGGLSSPQKSGSMP